MRKTFFCIDAHTCGNPVRLIVGGGPLLEGQNMMERRLHFLKEYDWIRRGLMFEPRGHDMMSGSILFPPSYPENDIGILFIETSGCLPMCGHGTIGTVTIMLEEGLVQPKEKGKLRLETPAGIVKVEYQEEAGKIKSVKIINVPSFLYLKDLEVDCPDLGILKLDVAYGGNFYAIIDPQENFSGIQYYTASQFIQWSPILRQQLNGKYTFQHPLHKNINGLSHILWTGDTIAEEADARNAVFYGDKAIDRSPCGTGTSARMAQWYAKSQLQKGASFIHESYIGSQFIGRIEEETHCGDYPAIIPSIEGWAKITGYNNIIIDTADDPYAYGFQVI
ncbi:MAG: 4-hydroxyproline epimerase [Saprospiraceae bacterium]|nr:4-hydroxyproline epimerase [Saprospiraceae bacterium]